MALCDLPVEPVAFKLIPAGRLVSSGDKAIETELRCWQIEHLTAAVTRSTMVSGSPHKPCTSAFISINVSTTRVHCASTRMIGDNRMTSDG